MSGLTLEELLEEGSSKSFRQKKIRQIRSHEAMESEELGGSAPAGPMPHHVRPMLSTLAQEPFDHPEWLFEVKWDGYRAVAEISEGNVSLYSRNLLSLNEKFFPVVESLRKFGFEAVLDGEIVVVDDQGQPDFELLQNYRKTGIGHLLAGPFHNVITGIDHFGATVTDVDRSLAFWRDLLGLEETERSAQSAYLRGYEEQYHHSLKVTVAPRAGLGHVAWRARSPQALERRVAAIEATGLGRGWTIGDVGHGRAYKFETPEGHRMELLWDVDYVTAPACRKP